MNFVDEFRAAMRQAGLDCIGEIVPDGIRHRFAVPDDKGVKNSWYQLWNDGVVAANFGCWKRGINQDWHQANGVPQSPKDRAECARKYKIAAQERERDQAELHARMAEKASAHIESLPAASPDHLYLQTKQVKPLGPMRENPEGDLVIPLTDAAGKIWSWQSIDALGGKLFMPGGRVQGCFYTLHDRNDGPLVICEGYATGASIHEATGWAVVCAMNCGNLTRVGQDLRKKYPQRTIILAADNDKWNHTTLKLRDKNPGLDGASAAAKSIKGLVAVPNFPDTDKHSSDFNDLQQVKNTRAVQLVLEAVVEVGLGQRVAIKSLIDFVPSEDPNSVIGDRYLCRGSSCMIVGQTHVGKSSFGMQMAIHWALGGDFFGMGPKRPMKSVIVQAENDDGDTAEMLQGILLGTGLLRDGQKQNNLEILKSLQQNLIIYRDQTHSGINFPAYAEKLIDLHKPDFFWVDPLLSFYGDDVNDQQAMSKFLRASLNPISERTGIIWMLTHHTGKPAKDQGKIQKGWSLRDFSYTGIGSSELSNWARAIISINHHSEGEFRVVLAKRGWRAGLKDDRGAPTSDLYLAHHAEHICWKRIPKPDDEKTDTLIAGFAKTITRPIKSAELMKLAERYFQRSIRTCWKLWDGGEGPLGRHFIQDGDLWRPMSETAPLPYKED